jgi:TolA-binding protein
MIRLSLGFLLLAGVAAPALAQSAPIEQRVDRVERELRAVQRKVFPGGAPAYSEPEIAAPAAAPPPMADPGGSGLNALSGRVDSLEREVEQLTGQVEQANHRLQIVSEQAAKDRAEFDGRLKTLEAAAAPPPTAAPTMADDQPMAAPPPPTRGRPGRGAPPKPFTIPPSAAPAPADDAVPAPDAAAATGDPAEDAYMAAYKLWDAKRYADAEAALKKVVAKYPRSRRASYAQNLLGRAYLDDGQPASAAEAFAANYQRDPKGERAPDSLYYLGQSLLQLKKPTDACRVYDELDSAYGATLSTSLKSREATARREAKCAK